MPVIGGDGMMANEIEDGRPHAVWEKTMEDDDANGCSFSFQISSRFSFFLSLPSMCLKRRRDVVTCQIGEGGLQGRMCW